MYGASHLNDLACEMALEHLTTVRRRPEAIDEGPAVTMRTANRFICMHAQQKRFDTRSNDDQLYGLLRPSCSLGIFNRWVTGANRHQGVMRPSFVSLSRRSDDSIYSSGTCVEQRDAP